MATEKSRNAVRVLQTLPVEAQNRDRQAPSAKPSNFAHCLCKGTEKKKPLWKIWCRYEGQSAKAPLTFSPSDRGRGPAQQEHFHNQREAVSRTLTAANMDSAAVSATGFMHRSCCINSGLYFSISAGGLLNKVFSPAKNMLRCSANTSRTFAVCSLTRLSSNRSIVSTSRVHIDAGALPGS